MWPQPHSDHSENPPNICQTETKVNFFFFFLFFFAAGEVLGSNYKVEWVNSCDSKSKQNPLSHFQPRLSVWLEDIFFYIFNRFFF